MEKVTLQSLFEGQEYKDIFIGSEEFEDSNNEGEKNLILKNKNFQWSIYINNICFNNISFDISIFEKEIEFNDCIFEGDFSMHNCSIKSLLIFNSCEFKEKVCFKNMDLWRTIFNWGVIHEWYLEDVNLSDCIFNGVDFSNSKLSDVKKAWWGINYWKMKDNYRQLKHVMDKNWNHTEANNFFSKEMQNYYLSLDWFSKDFNKKIILFIQGIISSFGNNWIMPIILIFGLSLITSWINYWYVECCYDFWELKVFSIDVGKTFLSLLYPLYWLKRDFFEWFDKTMISWFMIHKIIYWILFWHLIVALKRTTKR